MQGYTLTVCEKPCTIPLKKWKIPLFCEMPNPLSLRGYITVCVVENYISFATWKGT